MPINEALPGRTKMSLDQLDRGLRSVRAAAGRERRPRGDLGGARPAGRRGLDGGGRLAREASQELPGLRRLAARLVAEEKWPQAKEVLEKLKGLYPEYVGPENAYVLLASVYKQLSDPPRNARSSRSWRRRTATRARPTCG